jgi:hypothetical protein
MIRTNAHAGFSISSTNNGPFLSFRSSIGTLLSSNGTFESAGNFIADQNTTLGDAAADTVTFNANTATVVGQLNFNANTMCITNNLVMIGTNIPPANLVAKLHVNGAARADNYFYNTLTSVYGANGTGTNSIDFSLNMVVNITNVTAGLTLTSANLLAGRSTTIIFQGASASNTILTVPATWIPISPTFSTVVSNKYVAIHALSLSNADAGVVYSISQQP